MSREAEVVNSIRGGIQGLRVQDGEMTGINSEDICPFLRFPEKMADEEKMTWKLLIQNLIDPSLTFLLCRLNIT